VGSVVEGWRRVLRAPAITACVLAATFLLAVPLALALRGMLEEHLGTSLVADGVAAGWDAGWAAEFANQAQGLGRTFTHEILGFGGTLAITSGFADRIAVNPTLAGAIAAYLVLWLFLWGGILDRFARARPIRLAAFFSACGVFFVRFLRLAIPVGAAYWVILAWLHPWLFDDVYGRMTRNMTSEGDAIVLRLSLYAVLIVALLAVRAVADVAKVRAVVEDRRSMLGALAASVRFIRRRPLRIAALYGANVAALVVVLLFWFLAAPGATAAVWLAFLLAQIYLLLRLWTRLALAASLVVFFQGELAHVSYTAAPLPVWPDSPAAEALDNLARLRSDRSTDSPRSS
jgi:hypothetical protein